MTTSPHQLAALIKSRARALGFDLVGISSAQPSAFSDYFRQWLDDGRHGTMEWLSRRFDERTNPAVYLPGARSVICVAINYYSMLWPADSGEPQQARIARYTLGDDYHELLKPKLHALADFIRELVPDAQTRAAVDTAPVMEKELAARAGVGWLGKNVCIINEQAGSWLVLGEVLTTVELPADQPAVDRCGSCTRCIDACPTSAITGPYQLDARRCISYLTIEHRAELDEQQSRWVGEWIFGCDICQEVCPFNRKADETTEPAFKPRFPTGVIDPTGLLEWNEEQYREKLRGSAMKRVKLPMLKRNAQCVVGNLTTPPS